MLILTSWDILFFKAEKTVQCDMFIIQNIFPSRSNLKLSLTYQLSQTSKIRLGLKIYFNFVWMMLNDDNIHTRFECTKVPFPSEVWYCFRTPRTCTHAEHTHSLWFVNCFQIVGKLNIFSRNLHFRNFTSRTAAQLLALPLPPSPSFTTKNQCFF